MSPREAFRIFIRHQLHCGMDDGKYELSDNEIEKFANGIEDDQTFYDELDDFLADYINDFGENYGL